MILYCLALLYAVDGKSDFMIALYMHCISMFVCVHVCKGHLSHECPSALDLQWHLPSPAEHMPTLPLSSHSHSLPTNTQKPNPNKGLHYTYLVTHYPDIRSESYT